MTTCTVYNLARTVTCDQCNGPTMRLHIVKNPRPRGYCANCCPCARKDHDHPVRAPRERGTIPLAAPDNTAFILPSSRPLKPSTPRPAAKISSGGREHES
jgi:hypothetical protein